MTLFSKYNVYIVLVVFIFEYLGRFICFLNVVKDGITTKRVIGEEKQKQL